MKVPFVDLKTQYLSIKSEIDSAIQNVINDTAFIRGKYIECFEKEYAEAYGVKHVISCANGTDAIYISLKALGVGPGDEVITVANSWISTSETITQTGAKVVFVDIEPDFYNLDVKKIESKITSKTKAIIPVHLFGQPARIDKIQDICNKYNLFLIEDCAQSHFAEYNGKLVGTFGIAGTFSFYPGKNLGAYGDAGAIITNDDNFANEARTFANHGSLKKHSHKIEGINSRMDGIQAAILSIKLKYIDKWNEARIQNAMHYSKKLKVYNDFKIPKIYSKVKHVFHLYVIRINNRDKLKNNLVQNGIGCGIHYPTPLPFLDAYKYLKHEQEDFPISWEYQSKILSLPMYPELKTEQIEYILSSIDKVIDN